MVEVTVSHKSKSNERLGLIESLAFRYGAKEAGSGFCLSTGETDQVYLVNEEDVKLFKKDIRKLKGRVKGLKVYDGVRTF